MKKNILTLGAIALLFAACQNNGSQNNMMTNTTESTFLYLTFIIITTSFSNTYKLQKSHFLPKNILSLNF